MMRSLLACVLFIGALGLGVVVAGLASRNRARAADLDRRQHESETRQRQSMVQRALNQRDEYRLIRGLDANPTAPSTLISH